MPELLARILFLFLLFSLLRSWWEQSGGKDNPLLDRLRVLLLISLLILAFFAPDTPVGAAIFGLIAFFFKPLGFSLTLLVIASALITNGGIRNPAPRMILAALLVLILSSMPVVAYWFSEQAKRDAAARTVCCDETAAAIVLLGKGTTQPHIPNRVGGIQLTDTGNRLPYAAVLYNKKVAPLVIVTAGPRPELEGYVGEAKDIETLLANNMGVPRSSIVLDNNGSNIRTSAEEVRKILDSRGLGRKVILVTSAMQMRRASLTFAHMGIQVIPKPTDFYTFEPTAGGTSRLRLDAGDFLPTAQALVTTTEVFDEYFGSVYYYLRGWQAPRT
jgi:uncharacterized SAM-binding protein YcdF (DUF218 family)